MQDILNCVEVELNAHARDSTNTKGQESETHSSDEECYLPTQKRYFISNSSRIKKITDQINDAKMKKREKKCAYKNKLPKFKNQ